MNVSKDWTDDDYVELARQMASDALHWRDFTTVNRERRISLAWAILAWLRSLPLDEVKLIATIAYHWGGV